jgi:hypothetical protein
LQGHKFAFKKYLGHQSCARGETMIPVVKKLIKLGGSFRLPESGKIFSKIESFNIAKMLKQELSKWGKDFSIVSHSQNGSTFELLLDKIL